jgi:hypothetical protein
MGRGYRQPESRSDVVECAVRAAAALSGWFKFAVQDTGRGCPASACRSRSSLTVDSVHGTVVRAAAVKSLQDRALRLPSVAGRVRGVGQKNGHILSFKHEWPANAKTSTSRFQIAIDCCKKVECAVFCGKDGIESNERRWYLFHDKLEQTMLRFLYIKKIHIRIKLTFVDSCTKNASFLAVTTTTAFGVGFMVG